MRNAAGSIVNDARCQLLAKNLPALTQLNLGNNLPHIATTWITDLAAHPISQLHHLVTLNIGTGTSIQVGTMLATVLPNFWLEDCRSSLNCKSIIPISQRGGCEPFLKSTSVNSTLVDLCDLLRLQLAWRRRSTGCGEEFPPPSKTRDL